MKFLSIFLILIIAVSVNGQIISSSSSGRNDNKPELSEQADARIRQVINESGRYFKQGLLFLRDSRRAEAREEFDKSVEFILLSGVDVQVNQTMRECYSQLIETVYRMEFPSNQLPANIRSLSATCNWNIDNKLADDIAKLVISAPQNQPKSTDTALVTAAGVNNIPVDEKQIGFSEQVFEPSPLDELSKLELSQDEFNIKKTGGKSSYPYLLITNNPPLSAGAKPIQDKTGKVSLVVKHIYDTFNDPYSVKYLEWSRLSERVFRGTSYWVVSLKLRAKNLFNAYRLATLYFFIKDNKVIYAIEEEDYLKLDTTPKTNFTGETWQTLSNRTGVSIADLKAANPGMSAPNGKVFIPNSKSIQAPQYSRPNKPAVTAPSGVRIVIAEPGDTVAKIAARYNTNAVEIAKFNGLLPTSKLNAGREIKIPIQ